MVFKQPGTELLLLGFGQAQPQLAAAPQDVLQGVGPLAADQIAHFRLVQPGTKVLAAILVRSEERRVGKEC